MYSRRSFIQKFSFDVYNLYKSKMFRRTGLHQSHILHADLLMCNQTQNENEETEIWLFIRRRARNYWVKNQKCGFLSEPYFACGDLPAKSDSDEGLCTKMFTIYINHRHFADFTQKRIIVWMLTLTSLLATLLAPVAILSHAISFQRHFVTSCFITSRVCGKPVCHGDTLLPTIFLRGHFVDRQQGWWAKMCRHGWHPWCIVMLGSI